MKSNRLPVAALLLLFLGCDKKEPVPAYVSIQTIEVQGLTDQKIDDAWVYADGQFLGAFPLPAEVPVLKTGDVTITVQAGIDENGDYNTPSPYPILANYEIEVPLSSSKTTAIHPVMKHEDAAVVAFFDGFEPSQTSWFPEDKDGDPETKLTAVSDTKFEGERSAKVSLDTAHQIFEALSIQRDDLPILGRPCWLEISYKTDFPFTIGLAGADALGSPDEVQYFQTIYQKADWTKMYINLTEALRASGFKYYKVAIRARLPLDENGKPAILKGDMFLDNVRLVYLK